MGCDEAEMHFGGSTGNARAPLSRALCRVFQRPRTRAKTRDTNLDNKVLRCANYHFIYWRWTISAGLRRPNERAQTP